MAYQMALCSSVLKSLGDIYPDLPVGTFNDRVAFTAKDEVSKRMRVGWRGRGWEGCLEKGGRGVMVSDS